MQNTFWEFLSDLQDIKFKIMVYLLAGVTRGICSHDTNVIFTCTRKIAGSLGRGVSHFDAAKLSVKKNIDF